MADSRPAGADEREREKVRKWLQDWSATTPLLEAERDEQLAALTDDDAWRQCQDLFAAWEPHMQGDAGQGLELQQNVFRRWWISRRRQ